MRGGVIVVGIDGSLHSVDVLREGARIARATGCSLESVAVWQPQEILLDYGEMQRNPELEARQALFDTSKFAFGAELPNWYTTHSVPGDPAQILIDRSAPAEMLIVGTHGHSPIRKSIEINKLNWRAFTLSLQNTIETQTTISDIAAVRCPIRIIYGSLDPFVMPAALRILAQMRNVTIVRVNGADHLIRARMARAVAKAIGSLPATGEGTEPVSAAS
jgi:nucleotide-binding universal stress UspA family protein